MSAVHALRDAASTLEAWHRGPTSEQRPAGHLRPHSTTTVSRAERLWGTALLRTIVDPDGRPLRDELRGRG